MLVERFYLSSHVFHSGSSVSSGVERVLVLVKTVTELIIKEALLLLMLRAPSNRRRPFSYLTKMANFEYSRVLSVSS